MKLKEYRLKNNLTQKQVGEVINKTGTGYGYYESGKNQPDIDTLKTLADFYHTTIDDLVGVKREGLVNVNLLTNEERSVLEIMKKLNKDNQGKVEAYATFRLEEQEKK